MVGQFGNGIHHPLVALLKACAQKKDLCTGTRLHADAVTEGLLEDNPFVASALVSMYAKCGDPLKARQVLDELPIQSLVAWSALISGFVQRGQGNEALSCLKEMQHGGFSPDEVTYVSILKAYGCIGAADKGKRIHDEIVNQGLLEKSVTLGNALIDMYIKCGALDRAHHTLKRLPVCNTVSWNSLIAGYAQEGQGEEAWNCFEEMQSEGHHPDAITFSCILKACGNKRATERGSCIHDAIVKERFLAKSIVVGNSLVDMYAKCGALVQAQLVLDELPVRDVLSWNAMITGYAQHDQCKEVFSCFQQMQSEGLTPDVITLICILKACGCILAIELGSQIHGEIVKWKLLEKNIRLGNALVDMYAKCHSLLKAQVVLNELPIRDVVSWNALIGGYIQYGHDAEALHCFEHMRHEGLPPSIVTYVCVLKACGSIQAINKGKELHDAIAANGLVGKNIVIGNALVDMYARCGELAKARQMLDWLPVSDIVSWNALITGYTQQGHSKEALACFEHMQREGLSPDAITIASILKACGNMGAAEKGKQIHDDTIKKEFVVDTVVHSALVDMYAKCGMLVKARQVLEEFPIEEPISWNALINGCVQHDQCEEALNCLERMQGAGVMPDFITFICALMACYALGAVKMGQKIHDEIVCLGLLGTNVVLDSVLVDMYSKCGLLTEARQILHKLHLQNVVSWNAVMAGYAQLVNGKEVLGCFECMQKDGVCPDAITFTCVLNACSRSGLVDKGQMYVLDMGKSYGITPDLGHLTCMVDLFCQAGNFEKALSVVKKMPCPDYFPVLSTLLGASQKSGLMKLGQWAFKHAVQLDELC